MRPHRYLAAVDFAATFSQIADEFFARIELRAGWLIAIKIAHQADAERNIVQVIAVHMASIDLAPPAIADLDLAITSRCSVSNHKMIGKAILHTADMSMIIIKRARVSLPCAAVVHHYELPASTFYWRASNGFDD
jgi:hypothetical protein